MQEKPKKNKVDTVHSELVNMGYRWLLNQGCSFALKELVADSGETPDVIGWKGGHSILIEVKASRSDFFADSKKRFRAIPELGMGYYRFYLCPTGMIQPEELPDKWGLLWKQGKRIKRIVAPKGSDFYRFPHFERNIHAEQKLLISALRRVHQNGDLEKI